MEIKFRKTLAVQKMVRLFQEDAKRIEEIAKRESLG